MLFLFFGQFLLQYKEVRWPKLYLLLAFVAILLLFFLSRLDDNNKIARNAFVLIVIVGSLNSLILPVRQNLDENTHFFHALEISDGHLRRNAKDEQSFLEISPDFLAVTKLPSIPGYGSTINTNLYNKVFFELEHEKSNYKKELIKPGGLANPAYIPSALGIVFGKMISDRIFVYYYLGRIFNLVFFAILVYIAIKISKKYKIALFVIATVPYTLWLCAGYNYDSLYYGLILLILAQMTNFLSEKNVSMKKILIYSLSCAGLVFCKAPTLLLIFLPMFLPNKYFQYKKGKIKAMVIMLFSSFFAFLWMIQGTIISVFSKTSSMITLTDGSSSEENRLFYFFHNFTDTVAMFLRSFFDIIATIGQSISHPQPFLMSAAALNYINFFVFILLFILVGMEINICVPNKQMLGITVAIIIISLGIIYAISGDSRVFKVGELHVAGVQGRYHYYILALIPLMIKWLFNKKVKSQEIISIMQSENKNAMIMKMIFLITILNSSVALYGYL